MRILKLGLISMIFLFGLITLMSLLIPSHIRISRATNLAPGAEHILNQIADTSLWKIWHPAFRDSGKGERARPIYRKPVSQNSEEFVCLVQQGSSRPVTNGWKIYSTNPGDSLALQWYMDFQLSWYPWQKFGSLFYESAYGTMMEEGLTRLKTSAQ